MAINEEECMFCEIDRTVLVARRPATYAMVIDFALTTENIRIQSWQHYTNCCREHALAMVDGTEDMTKICGVHTPNTQRMIDGMRESIIAVYEGRPDDAFRGVASVMIEKIRKKSGWPT